MIGDLRHALHVLWKDKGFTSVAVATLALGIGANTALFSVVYGVVLRPLPLPEPDRLLRVYDVESGGPDDDGSASIPNFRDWSAGATRLSLGGWMIGSSTLSGQDVPSVIDTGLASGALFETLGVAAQIGRTIEPRDDVPGAERVAVLSHAAWRRLFDGDRDALGRSLVLDEETFTVVGVLPPGFRFPFGEDRPEMWVPMLTEPFVAGNAEGRSAHMLNVLGRLRDGVTREEAEAELVGIAAQLAQEYPERNATRTVRTQPLQDAVVGPVRTALLVLLAAVAGVLAIACVNVANLQLVRGVARRRELAIRAALGAGRGRLLRQMLVESLVLAVAGGALGVLLAYWGLGALLAISPIDVPRVDSVGIETPVLLFALAASLLTGVAFGLLPAWRATRGDLARSLHEGSARVGFSGAQARLRQGLVVAEVAIALTLLAASGLLVRSFVKLGDVDPGFRAEGVLGASLSLPESRYSEGPTRVAFTRDLLARLEARPEVTRAAAVLPLPLSGNQLGVSFEVEGRPVARRSDRPTAQYFAASPGYFETLGIPLRRGRVFTERDELDSPLVVLISESFAEHHFPDDEALGRHLVVGLGDDTPREIVGIVGDVKRDELQAAGAEQFYTPLAQVPWRFFDVVVRTEGPPSAAIATLRSTLAEVDPTQAAAEVRPLSEYVSRAVAQPRFNAFVIAGFGGLALLLAMLGVYGLLAWIVEQRSREIGIRLSLGAQAADVTRMIMGQGALLIGIGAALGFALSLAASQGLQSLLFGVTRSDPPTHLGVVTLLVVTALIAAWLPVRRATRTDPVRVLRAE